MAGLKNPGKYEDHNREAKSVVLGEHEIIEGARVVFSKPILQGRRQDVSITHGVSMGSSRMPADYNFSAQFQNHMGFCSARWDSNKTRVINGKIKLSNMLSASAFFQFVPTGNDFHSLEVDLRGKISESQVKKSGSQIFLSHMQAVSPTLALGSQVQFSYTTFKTVVAGCARFDTEKLCVTGEIATDGDFFTSYTQKFGPKANVVVSLSGSLPSRDSTVKFAWEYLLAHSRIRGVIESNGRVACAVEERITPQAVLQLHGELDHVKETYRFGMGMTIG